MIARRAALGLAVPLLLAACSPARVRASGPATMTGLARPDHVYVYDFTITPQAVALDQGVRARRQRGTDPAVIAADQARAAANATAALRDELIADLGAHGLPAQRLTGAPPQAGVRLIVQGRILTLDEGNRTRRLLIGFGAGQSRLSADAALYYAGPGQAPRLLRRFTLDADSGKMPGAAGTMGLGAAAGTAVAASAAASAGAHAADETRNTGDAALADKAASALAAQIAQYAAAQGWIAADLAK